MRVLCHKLCQRVCVYREGTRDGRRESEWELKAGEGASVQTTPKRPSKIVFHCLHGYICRRVALRWGGVGWGKCHNSIFAPQSFVSNIAT